MVECKGGREGGGRSGSKAQRRLMTSEGFGVCDWELELAGAGGVGLEDREGSRLGVRSEALFSLRSLAQAESERESGEVGCRDAGVEDNGCKRMAGCFQERISVEILTSQQILHCLS